MPIRQSIAFAVILLIPGILRAGVTDNVDWSAFMSRHDLRWNQIPQKWEQAPFTGNGQMGATVYLEDGPGPAGAKMLAWHMGRRDVVFRGERIAIGDLVLRTTGAPTAMEMRQDLWNAEVVGDLTTSKGKVHFRTFTASTQMVQVIEVQPDAGECDCHFEWKPGIAVDSALVNKRVTTYPQEQINPPPTRKDDGPLHVSVQTLNTGGEHATAWVESVLPNEGGKIVYLGIGFCAKGDAAEKDAAVAANGAASDGIEKVAAAHREWWHNFYPASFVSIPDTRLESFYWIQMYKLGSATRADVPVMDTLGPFFRVTNFARTWWNLNVQLQYWPVLGSNHLDLAMSMINTLEKNKDHLSANAGKFADDSYALGRSGSYDLSRKAGHELGDLPWAMHNYWLQYRYSMDEPMLRDRIFPLLKGSINYYLHLLKEGPDGKLHIPDGFSPEYPDQSKDGPNPDCNYDLSLLRWGCQTLLDICARFNIDDPLVPKWKDTLARLTPYPVDSNGLMIAAGIPYAVTHRHYSHMLMIYPLYLMNWENPADQELIQKSFNHWTSLPQRWAGFSYTGAASISASMGQGDDAINYLNGLLDKKIHPNTMYTEGSPVIETPLSAAQSLHDMLLQSWGDKIRVFPAVPSAWKDVTIRDMRTEGAFLVTAVRRGGITQFVQIKSLAGAPCHVRTDLVNPTTDSTDVAIKPLGENLFDIGLAKGQSVVLHASGTKPDFVVDAVTPRADRTNYWGVHK